MTSPSHAETGTASANRPVSEMQRRSEHLKHEIHHFAHMLSEQGPMNITFVHNNTLLGLQHLHFDKAIAEAKRVLGANGYEPLENFRAYFARGRINSSDLQKSMSESASVGDLSEVVASVGGVNVLRSEVLRSALLQDLADLSPAAMRHVLEDGSAAERLSPGLSAEGRKILIDSTKAYITEAAANVGRQTLLLGLVELVVADNLVERLCQRAAGGRLEHHVDAANEATVKNLLASIGIPQDRHEGYLRCIDQISGAKLDENPEACLRHRIAVLTEEKSMLGTVCSSQLHCDANLDAVLKALAQDPERTVAMAVWAHVFRLEATDDPRLVGVTAAAGTSGVPNVDEFLSGFVSAGVLPIRLDRALRSELRQLVVSALGSVGANTLGQVEALEEQIDNGYLDVQGLAAVESLAKELGTHSDLVQRLQELNPVACRAQHIAQSLSQRVASLGTGRTLTDFLEMLGAEPIVDRVNTYMIKNTAAFLDEGLASWRMPNRHLGFYRAWKESAVHDASVDIDGIRGWTEALAALPDQADEALIQMLDELEIPESAWGEYLGRMLAQLKGWAGMVYWYETHPQQYKQSSQPIDTIQYLAVRLFIERLLLERACREEFGVAARVGAVTRYLEIHPLEYLLREQLHQGNLNDSVADAARHALARRRSDRHASVEDAANAVWLHHVGSTQVLIDAARSHRLVQLLQHLAIPQGAIQALAGTDAVALQALLNEFSPQILAPIWLASYERHYRDEVLNALSQNVGKGRWAKGRTQRPRSQVVFCIDEREENLHRHYAELDPEHETLGAAGFFGVAQSFTALDDHSPTPLCPAVATPAHRILEIPRLENLDDVYPVHKRRGQWMEVLSAAYWEIRRNFMSSFFAVQAAGVLSAFPLLGRVVAPRGFFRLSAAVNDAVVPPVKTRLTHIRFGEDEVRRWGLHVNGLPIGFAVPEGTDRVEAQLRNWGLTYQFSRIVVICAHRSFSMNNPHENAHDCGACGGKAGGPNSRLFAALANDPQVRATLRSRGIDIPDDTWFVGAEHNTCSDEILCFDTEDIPVSLQADWALVKADLEEARRRAARERCRRFGSAPKDASLEASLRHVETRSNDMSQVRPEWGHATNAFALVGRRCVTQGIFFDRRGFVISYDPTQDADGSILERILMAVGPVGAGINLEYYFSTVDPDNYGCGTKVPHNVTGMIGVMAGAQGDLQTGLPRQMTEIHEAMRLQLIVDAKMEVLGGIYGRQPAIQQLLDNQWVHLVAHDPDTGELNMFVPGKGFVKWDEPLTPLPEVSESYEWFKGKYECFIPPARIKEPTRRWTEHAKAH